jgi:uncharacterized protein YbjT (DUF2867 family)
MQLARLPVHGVPGLTRMSEPVIAPMQCADAAQAICRICEHPKALRRAIELAGPQELRYGEFLAQLRASLNLRPAFTLRMPWWLMKLTALIAEHLPQKVLSADGVRLLRTGLTTPNNEALYWLRMMPKPIVARMKSAQIAFKLEVNEEAST